MLCQSTNQSTIVYCIAKLPDYVPTKYFSQRSMVKALWVLKAIVVRDRLYRRPERRLVAGYVVGIIGYVSGLVASTVFDLPTGAMIVVALCLTFILSVILVKAHTVTW